MFNFLINLCQKFYLNKNLYNKLTNYTFIININKIITININNIINIIIINNLKLIYYKIYYIIKN